MLNASHALHDRQAMGYQVSVNRLVRCSWIAGRRVEKAVTESDPVCSVSIDDIDYTDDLYVVYEGDPFTGEVVDRYPNGQLCKVQAYENGRPRGLERTFYPDGTIESEYWNADGGWHGVGRTWFPNGQPESETQYDHGQVVRRKRWSEDGADLS